jgi:hypothetical protein
MPLRQSTSNQSSISNPPSSQPNVSSPFPADGGASEPPVSIANPFSLQLYCTGNTYVTTAYGDGRQGQPFEFRMKVPMDGFQARTTLTEEGFVRSEVVDVDPIDGMYFELKFGEASFRFMPKSLTVRLLYNIPRLSTPRAFEQATGLKAGVQADLVFDIDDLNLGLGFRASVSADLPKLPFPLVGTTRAVGNPGIELNIGARMHFDLPLMFDPIGTSTERIRESLNRPQNPIEEQR